MLVLGPPARAWKRKRYARHDCFRPRRTGSLVEVSAYLGKTEVIQGKRAHLHRAQPDRTAEVALKLRPAYSPVLLRKQSEYYHRPSECSPLSERKTEKNKFLPPTWPPVIEPAKGSQLQICAPGLPCAAALPITTTLGSGWHWFARGTCLSRHLQVSELCYGGAYRPAELSYMKRGHWSRCCGAIKLSSYTYWGLC
jgi:hypothetical protein